MNKNKLLLDIKIMLKNLIWFFPFLISVLYLHYFIIRNISTLYHNSNDNVPPDLLHMIIPEKEVFFTMTFLQFIFWILLIISFFIPSFLKNQNSHSVYGSRIVLKAITIMFFIEWIRLVTVYITTIPAPNFKCRYNLNYPRPQSLSGIIINSRRVFIPIY